MNANLPAASPPAAPPANSFWKMPRRDFFFGGLAGLMVGKGSEFVQPLEWTQATLPKGTKFSFAQFGEDLVVNGLLGMIGVKNPTYLDIGAWEPIESNNTYLFYQRGCRGVLVEPNPVYTGRLKGKRPGDVTLQAGIGIDDTPELDYYMFEIDQMNTFDKKQVEHLLATLNVKVERVVKMPMVAINRVMTEHFAGKAPDYLSIDVEGLDLAILKTLDFGRFRPKVICAETVITGTLNQNSELLEFMGSLGYVIRGGTHPNTVYLDGKLLG